VFVGSAAANVTAPLGIMLAARPVERGHLGRPLAWYRREAEGQPKRGCTRATLESLWEGVHST
jgi:hypothetical protein